MSKKELNPQQKYDRIQEIKEQIKSLSEEQSILMEEFNNTYEDCELPIVVDGKDKFIRVYEPEGRFVHNVKYEVGVRATAQKPWNDKEEGE